MSKKCGHNHNCGCKDAPFLTPAPCPPGTDCPETPQCPQVWDAKCVIYYGDEIVDLGITPGMSMNDVMEILLLNSLNPTCVDPTGSCQSVLNVHSITVTSSSVLVGWNNAPNATQYIVEYKLSTDLSWTSNPAVIAPNHQDTIGGLAPASDYYIRVNAFNTDASPTCSCYSLTIQVTTLNAS